MTHFVSVRNVSAYDVPSQRAIVGDNEIVISLGSKDITVERLGVFNYKIVDNDTPYPTDWLALDVASLEFAYVVASASAMGVSL